MTKSRTAASSLPAATLCAGTMAPGHGSAEWAEKRFAAESGVRAVIRQQWSPELAEGDRPLPIHSFLDCSGRFRSRRGRASARRAGHRRARTRHPSLGSS